MIRGYESAAQVSHRAHNAAERLGRRTLGAFVSKVIVPPAPDLNKWLGQQFAAASTDTPELNAARLKALAATALEDPRLTAKMKPATRQTLRGVADNDQV